MAEETKRCARCGGAFGCGARAGRCWCEELPPVLAPGEGDCLCPACLRAEASARVGQCLDCRHAQTLKTKSGAAVFLCGLSASQPRYAKYPPLPMRRCDGHEPPRRGDSSSARGIDTDERGA